MSVHEIGLADGSVCGINREPARPDVSDGEVLDTYMVVLAKAMRIAQERREGKCPARSREQTKDHRAEVERLVTLSQQLKASPANSEVDRLVELAQKER